MFGGLWAKLGIIAAGLAAALSALGALLWSAKRSGRTEERLRTERADREAIEERLEMHREANDIERAARDLGDDEAREEAKRWSR